MPLSLVGDTRGRKGFKTMKLLRTAFWMGITIYCLPSTNSQPTAPQSSLNSSQCKFNTAVNTSRLCAWVSERYRAASRSNQTRRRRAARTQLLARNRYTVSRHLDTLGSRSAVARISSRQRARCEATNLGSFLPSILDLPSQTVSRYSKVVDLHWRLEF